MTYNIKLENVKLEINDFLSKMERCKYYEEIKGILETLYCKIRTVIEYNLDMNCLKVYYNNLLLNFISKRLTEENFEDEKFVMGALSFCCSIIRTIISSLDEDEVLVYNKDTED